jgi:hypothetical protein
MVTEAYSPPTCISQRIVSSVGSWSRNVDIILRRVSVWGNRRTRSGTRIDTPTEEMAQRQFLCGRLLNFPLLLYLPEQPYGHAQVLDSCGDGIPISQPHIFMVRFGQLSTAMALQPSNLRPQATTHPIAAVASSSSSQSQPSVTMGFQHYNLQQPHAPAGLKGSHPETNNPKPSRWDNADSTKIIQTGPSYVTYEFKGVRCQHTKPCSNTPSSAPSPLSPEHSGETTRLTVDETS